MSWSSLTGTRSLTAPRLWSLRTTSAVVLPLVAIAGVGAANGGFFPTAFGWTGLAFCWAVVVAVSLLAARWRPLDIFWVGSAAAVCLFTFLSALWAGSTADAMNAGFRSIVYAAGITGAMVVLRRRDISMWLGGLVLGDALVCIYGLATRLLPAHFRGFDSSIYRLFEPLGYWNALGIFSAVGLLLAIGVATHGRGLVLRVLNATAAVALAPTLLFTFSRGALAALAGGAAVMVALSPARLRLLAALGTLGATPALAVLLASRKDALTHQGATLAGASAAGHSLAVELVALAIVQAMVAATYVLLSGRIEVPVPARRVFGGGIVIAGLGVAAAFFARCGSPLKIARDAYHSFGLAAPLDPNLNGRFLSLSNNGRTVLWHAAWHDFLAHPIVGSGAGGFERWWFAHRSSTYFVTYAYNLYVQTLAEYGIVGFLLLVVLLGMPLAAAVRARRNPLVAPATGAYVAFLLHAGLEWDWEMPAVTLLALFTGAALLVAAHNGETAPAPMHTAPRIAIGAVAVVAGGAAFVGLIGNIAIARSNSAILAGDGHTAAVEAAKAHRWAPWSTEALDDLALGRLLAGSTAEAVDAARQAARNDPRNWEAWYELATVATGAMQHQAIARARALNPASPEITGLLETSLVRPGS